MIWLLQCLGSWGYGIVEGALKLQGVLNAHFPLHQSKKVSNTVGGQVYYIEKHDANWALNLPPASLLLTIMDGEIAIPRWVIKSFLNQKTLFQHVKELFFIGVLELTQKKELHLPLQTGISLVSCHTKT